MADNDNVELEEGALNAEEEARVYKGYNGGQFYSNKLSLAKLSHSPSKQISGSWKCLKRERKSLELWFVHKSLH